MRVLLLRPAAEKKSMARVLPLGLLAIGSVLKRAGHQVKILDLRISNSPDEELESVMRSFDPQVVGIAVDYFIKDNSIYSMTHGMSLMGCTN